MFRGSRVDEIMTLLFMLFAIAAGVCFFSMDSRTAFYVCGGLAVIMRLIQYIIRYFK